ncbi:unnamed protein product [Pylaiella littoralis]
MGLPCYHSDVLFNLRPPRVLWQSACRHIGSCIPWDEVGTTAPSVALVEYYTRGEMKHDGSVEQQQQQDPQQQLQQQQQQQQENKARLRNALAKISGGGIADDFAAKLAQGLHAVRRALDDFGGGGLAISFNGGKDACVVLYLLLFVLAERDELWRLSSSTTGRERIPVVYFEKEEFPEIEAFIKEVSDSYGFEFLRYAVSYKDGMQNLVDSRGIEGVIMGQRRGDPWTESMDIFTPSTPGWAKFTRVNPALEWKFCDVWRLLRGSGLPYCVLYDQGYTSLGERGDTAKNEALRLPDGGYRPAYELAEQEEHLERAPRTPVASPRSPTRGSGSGDGGDGEDGGDGGGVGGAGGDGQKRFSSWDEKWDALDVDSAHDGTSAAASAAGGARSGGGGIISGDARSSEGGSVLMGIASNTIGIACRLPDGSKAPGGSGGGVGGALTGWVGSWLPLTTIVVALVLAALGVRSSSGSSRGGEYDSPPDKD